MESHFYNSIPQDITGETPNSGIHCSIEIRQNGCSQCQDVVSEVEPIARDTPQSKKLDEKSFSWPKFKFGRDFFKEHFLYPVLILFISGIGGLVYKYLDANVNRIQVEKTIDLTTEGVHRVFTEISSVATLAERSNSLKKILLDAAHYDAVVNIQGKNGTNLEVLPLKTFLDKLERREYAKYLLNQILLKENVPHTFIIQLHY